MTLHLLVQQVLNWGAPGALALVHWGTVICMAYCARQVWEQRWALGHLPPLGLSAERTWMVPANSTKASLCSKPHHIHHVMPLRHIWLDISATLMWLRSASAPLMANFSLYCLFLAIEIIGKGEGIVGVPAPWKTKFIINSPVVQKQARWLTPLYSRSHKALICAE